MIPQHFFSQTFKTKKKAHMSTIAILDNRSTRDTLKASMTDRLIRVLGKDARVMKRGPLPKNTEFLVLSGSSRCISRGEIHQPAVDVIQEAMRKGIPILGICYGFQLLAHLHGYDVERLPKMVREDRLVNGVGRVRFHHGDRVKDVPCMHAFSDKVWGVQFHPESTTDGVIWLHEHIISHTQ